MYKDGRGGGGERKRIERGMREGKSGERAKEQGREREFLEF